MPQQNHQEKPDDETDIERPDADDVFPFPTYRENQKEALEESSEALWEDEECDNVLEILPVGIGKSPNNTALGRQAEDAFMTTPLKTLRHQLEDDQVLNKHYEVLRGRADYVCRARNHPETGKDYSCKNCPVSSGKESETTCRDMATEGCTYWKAKEDAMMSDFSVITLAYLIIDSYLPVTDMANDRPQSEDDRGGTGQISFDDRELLEIDEAHKLVDNVASMHAGIVISPWKLPNSVYGTINEEVHTNMKRMKDVSTEVQELAIRATEYIDEFENVDEDSPRSEELNQGVEQCEEFKRKWGYALSEIKDGRPWVVEVNDITGPTEEPSKRIVLKPVDVDKFLQEKVWSRAEKIVLSTATMPYLQSPEKWLQELGLDPEKTKVVQKDMPFPVENRPIHTDTIIGEFSSGGLSDHWDEVVEEIKRLSMKHKGQKGLIHTVSYDRGWNLHSKFSDELKDNAIVHEQNSDDSTSVQLDKWQFSDEDIFLSPACMEGVDLHDEKCEWQVLLKVPYPNTQDSRWNYLINERSDWERYYETALRDIVQSYGRGIRHKDDQCDYYVLDECFNDVMNRAGPPEWFTDAIQ